jgi:hypothetical protein
MWDHMWNRWVECWEVGLIVGFCDLAIQNIWVAMPMRNYFGINHFYKIDNKWHDLAYGNYQCHNRPIVLIDHTSLEMYVDVYVNWILVGWLAPQTTSYYIKYYDFYLVLKDIDLSLMVFFLGT